MTEMTMRSRTVRPGLPGWCARLPAAARSAVLPVLAAVLGMVIALRGLAGLVLISFGAWLAYHPAGFIVAGLGLLADRVADERAERRR